MRGWSKAIGALLLLGAQSAVAGTLDPFVSGSYYEQNGATNCASGAGLNDCRVSFDAPPSGKELLITRVSCALATTSTKPINVYLAVPEGGSDKRQHMLTPVWATDRNPAFYYLLNDTIADYPTRFPPHVVMQLADRAAGSLRLDCQIAGSLRKLR